MIITLSNGIKYDNDISLNNQNFEFLEYYYTIAVNSDKIEIECDRQHVGNGVYRYNKEVVSDGILKLIFLRTFQDEDPTSKRALAVANNGFTTQIELI